MIINRAKGWAVVMPPRTASHTLAKLLTSAEFGGEVFGEYPRDHHRMRVPDDLADGRIFGVVRHPFHRLESLYRWLKLDELNRGLRHDYLDTFTAFVLAVSFGDERIPRGFRMTCSDYLNNAQRIDDVVRTEQIAADLHRLGLADGAFVVPRENVGVSVPCIWTQAARDQAAHWGAEDIARFGYGAPV